MKLRKLQRNGYGLLAALSMLLLQACSSYSLFSYRVRSTESYHEEYGYAFECVMRGDSSRAYAPSLLVTIGIARDSEKNGLKRAGNDPCPSANEIESVSLSFAGGNDTLTLVRPAARYKYWFTAPLLEERLKRHKKLILKLYFKGRQVPKIYFLKRHEERATTGLRLTGC